MTICVHCKRQCNAILDSASWDFVEDEPVIIDIVSDCCLVDFTEYDEDYIETFQELITGEDYEAEELTEEDTLLMEYLDSEV